MRVGWCFQQSFSHRFAFEFDAVGGLYEPVEDGVRERGVRHGLVPVFDRHLTGSDRGAFLDPVIENLKEAFLLRARHTLQAPIIEHEHIQPGQRVQDLQIAAARAGEREFFEQARQAVVAGLEAFQACLVGEGTGNEALARTGGAGNDHIEMVADPVATGQIEHQPLIQPARRAKVQIFDAGRLVQVRAPQSKLQGSVCAGTGFPIDHEAYALHEAQPVAFGLCQLITQRVGHAVEAKLFEFVNNGMV